MIWLDLSGLDVNNWKLSEMEDSTVSLFSCIWSQYEFNAWYSLRVVVWHPIWTNNMLTGDVSGQLGKTQYIALLPFIENT